MTHFLLSSSLRKRLAGLTLVALVAWLVAGVVAQSGAGKAPTTDAEKISQLTRTIEADAKQLEELQEEMKNPNCEFSKAETFFKEIDKQRSEFESKRKELAEAGKTEEVKRLEDMGKSLKTKWEDARKRFDLAIKERKTQQELAESLKKKIAEDQQALDKLRGTKPEPATPAEGKKETPKEKPTEPKTKESAKANEAPEKKEKPTKAEEKKPDLTKQEKEKNEQLEQAKKDAHAKGEAAKAAQQNVESIGKRLEALQKSISLDRKLLLTGREKSDQAQKAAEQLEKELFSKMGSGAPREEVREIQNRLEDAHSRARDARTELREISDRLHQRDVELQKLVAEENALRREAERKLEEAKAASERVEALQSPFHPENIRLWLYRHGPKILAIIIGMFLLRWIAKLFSHRVIRVVTHRRKGPRATNEDRANRNETLVSVFQNFTTLLIFVGGVLMILDEVGVPIIPLMGGAAVLGLAVAFGAQNLIRDYFSGFMVLMEDQYSINDVVELNGVSGTVEYISLRMTVLRDVGGIVHFIPHGIITSVSNMTHGWSRALFEIGVAYKENVDRVMKVLTDLALEMRQDPVFGTVVVDDPQMLGVDGFGDSAVVIKFYLKTKPLKQWIVKRELLRRIKNRFDELGIEIPFPHRTVYHRNEEAEGTARQVA